MNRSMKIIIAAALIGGAASWYFKAEEQSGSYLTQKLEKGDITEKITASGTINPISTINIGTQVSGTISEIYVDYNSKVKKTSCWRRLIRRCLRRPSASAGQR